MLSMYAKAGVVTLLLGLSLAQEIIESPTNITVFLNKSAVFECETSVHDGLSGWKVNGTVYNSLPAEIRSDLVTGDGGESERGNRIITLTVPAKIEYNETSVQCVTAESGGDLDESETVRMTVQGLLAPVADLTATSNATSTTISWSPPFTLDVTGVNPDIWYSVLIHKFTTAIPCTDCINITETHYTFTPAYPSPCHEYTHRYIFTVIPLNGAGQGRSRGILKYLKSRPVNIVIEFTRSDIAAGVDDGCIITFKTCGDLECVYDYTLQGVASSVLMSGHLENGANISYALPENMNYSTYFEVVTSTGSINISHDSFTTFDVQELSFMRGDDGVIVVEGELITDSRARGCFLVLQGNFSTADMFRVLQRNGQRVFGSIGVPLATYAVYGYDIEEDGLPNSTPALALSIDTVAHNNNSQSISTSMFLERVGIHRNGSEVTVDCAVSNDYPDASCVLVYRESDNPTLTVRDFPNLAIFSITLHVDRPESYTFAVFGRNGASEMESEPAFIVKFEASSSVDQLEPSSRILLPSPGEKFTEQTNNNFPKEVVAISAAVVAVCVITCTLVGILFLIVRRKSKPTNNPKVSLPKASNVIYDYITLPKRISASAIPTEEYATSISHQTDTSINTDRNVAYFSISHSIPT